MSSVLFYCNVFIIRFLQGRQKASESGKGLNSKSLCYRLVGVMHSIPDIVIQSSFLDTNESVILHTIIYIYIGYMSRITRKPTLWTLRKVSTRISH